MEVSQRSTRRWIPLMGYRQVAPVRGGLWWRAMGDVVAGQRESQVSGRSLFAAQRYLEGLWDAQVEREVSRPRNGIGVELWESNAFWIRAR